MRPELSGRAEILDTTEETRFAQPSNRSASQASRLSLSLFLRSKAGASAAVR
jgi:hypothetical protein